MQARDVETEIAHGVCILIPYVLILRRARIKAPTPRIPSTLSDSYHCELLTSRRSNEGSLS